MEEIPKQLEIVGRKEKPKQLEIVGRKEKHMARLMNNRFVEDT